MFYYHPFSILSFSHSLIGKRGLLRAQGVPGPVKPVIPERPGTVVHALKVVQGACILYVVCLALFVKWLKPGALPLFGSILLGVALGIGYSFLHSLNRARQSELSKLVSSLTPPILSTYCSKHLF